VRYRKDAWSTDQGFAVLVVGVMGWVCAGWGCAKGRGLRLQGGDQIARRCIPVTISRNRCPGLSQGAGKDHDPGARSLLRAPPRSSDSTAARNDDLILWPDQRANAARWAAVGSHTCLLDDVPCDLKADRRAKYGQAGCE